VVVPTWLWPEQALNGVEVDASFEQMGGEAVSQGVNAALGASLAALRVAQ
jgi:hypothetical protein